MKRILLYITMLSPLFLVSCKGDYNCVCKMEIPNSSGGGTTTQRTLFMYPHTTENKAKKACEEEKEKQNSSGLPAKITECVVN